MTDASDYAEIIREKPWCWACGRDNRQRPKFWAGAPWYLQRAHIAAGSGTMPRLVDRRAIIVLCPLCHHVHRHTGGQVVKVNGQDVRTLGDEHTLWIKCVRDPEHCYPTWISEHWIGNPPAPNEPTWLRDEYASRQGSAY